MPYIRQEARENIDASPPDNPGELNYILTQAVVKYLNFHGTSYQSINDVVGALESCKLEFYRRVAVPYENRKIEENGDVYPRWQIT